MHALREELRKRDYLPILFDFAVPATRDITETVSLLARMARFIIADLTDPSSIPKELEASNRGSRSRCLFQERQQIGALSVILDAIERHFVAGHEMLRVFNPFVERLVVPNDVR